MSKDTGVAFQAPLAFPWRCTGLVPQADGMSLRHRSLEKRIAKNGGTAFEINLIALYKGPPIDINHACASISAEDVKPANVLSKGHADSSGHFLLLAAHLGD